MQRIMIVVASRSFCGCDFMVKKIKRWKINNANTLGKHYESKHVKLYILTVNIMPNQGHRYNWEHWGQDLFISCWHLGAGDDLESDLEVNLTHLKMCSLCIQ